MNSTFYNFNNITLQKLDDRQIDIHLIIRVTVLIPVAADLAGFPEDMVPDRIDQSQILCKRNKLCR